MKKTVIYSIILTCIFIFAPAFMVQLDENTQQTINNEDVSKDNNDKKVDIKDTTNDISIFSSKTCFKKTYYVNANKINVYEDSSGNDKIIFTLPKDDVVVAYKENNGYLYCEENNEGKKGWIKKNSENLKGAIYKKTEYTLDVNLTNQNINVIKKDKVLKRIQCSTGILGDQETETPLGIFNIQCKGEYFYSNKYKEGARYYIKFFSNYLIHSIPVDKKGNIIEDEKKKIGFPASHGCIRISIQDAEWIYNNIPEGSSVVIHY
ncbi:L,D-transpeptidase [Clostridium sp. OS1-26]|uniref:L,D-transpeptidase family protein n=1 Tax=Clostridium sp. OS1-26 TaxID=3070681 RepID=UPI0027DF55ED|nr:L,D-transpeptidase [Clostridium sp. OS1-26]WML36453.1 L,D-transpeptidase [Clostridium sp. OS1-26]